MDHLSNNKVKLCIGLGLVGLVFAVKTMHSKWIQSQLPECREQKKEQQFNLDKQIQIIQDQIDADDPSLSDLKIVLNFSMDASKRIILKNSKKFKQQRKKFDHMKRTTNISEYLQLVLKGMNQIQQLGTSLQSEILQKLGIPQTAFMKYQNQLGPFINEQMMSQATFSSANSNISIEQVKKAIMMQIQYINKYGNQLVEKIINDVKNWPQKDKNSLPLLLSVFIADEVFEDYPEYDEDQLQSAQMKYQTQLQNQMQQMQQVMSPMMNKLTKVIGGQKGGMGGLMNPMASPMDMGGMDMGMGGITMEQIEQLRMQDPAAFDQMMQAMQMQMGMMGR